MTLHADLCTLLHLDPERATADDVLRLVGELSDRAQEAERQDRIAALREALECIRDECQLGAHAAHIIDETIAADDAAASAPLPDLPLAEGGRWAEEEGDTAVIDGGGLVSRIVRPVGAPAVVVTRTSDPRANRSRNPYLLDVLALARRKGLV